MRQIDADVDHAVRDALEGGFYNKGEALSQLAQIISEVTRTRVTYHDLPAKDYADTLQRAGLDEATTRFVAALDVSIAHGDLGTSSTDLANLLGRAPTGPAEIVCRAYESLA